MINVIEPTMTTEPTFVSSTSWDQIGGTYTAALEREYDVEDMELVVETLHECVEAELRRHLVDMHTVNDVLAAVRRKLS